MDKILVSLSDWEEKIRDQRSLEIIEGLLKLGYTTDKQLAVVCGIELEEEEVSVDFAEIFKNPVKSAGPEDVHITISDNIPHSEEEPEPKLTRNTAKKNIDKGRVLALHNAGWTNSKIADDVGCAPSRITQILKEVL